MYLEQLLKKYKQHEVDFVLPKKKGDTHAYLDLYLLYSSPDKRWHKVQSIIFSYLNFLLSEYRSKKMNDATLVSKLYFPEVPYIALGHCKEGIYGRGTGADRAEVIKDYIYDNEDVKKVGLNALATMSIAIGGLGPDLLSDMVANFGMNYLLEYTDEQVKIYGLKTTGFQISRALDPRTFEWNPLPVVQLPYFEKTGEPRIFVPRHLIKRLPFLTTGGFFGHYLQYVLQEEKQDRINSIRTLVSKPKVTLKEIIAELQRKYDSTGEAARELALKKPQYVERYLRNPNIYKKTRTRKKKDDVNWLAYAEELKKIPVGTENAHRYAEYIRKIFTALYSGDLVNGELDRKSEDGLYYYDINFANAAQTRFFKFVKNQNLKAGVVIFEAKNYGKTKVGNAAFNQSVGYTIADARELVLLVSREGVTEKSITRAQRHFLTKKVLVLPISDKDLIEILSDRKNNSEDFDTPFIKRAQKIMQA